MLLNLENLYPTKGLLPIKQLNLSFTFSLLEICRHRPAFNYDAFSPFQILLYDTKHILDKNALPPYIYDKFKLNPDLPIYEYNIFDVKSGFRFLAYSHKLNATFGLYFLKFVIMFIRSIGVDFPISVFFDGGIEFVSNSEKKLQDWNNIFSHFNTTCFLYDSPNDSRKNPIKRSHKIDDEEFLIPRGYYINSKEDFIKEASRYSYYYNFERISHSDYRYGKTPFQIVSVYLKPYFYKYLINFPTLILDDCISDLIYHTKTIDTLHHLLNNPLDFSNPKSVIDFKYKFNIQNNIFAQNVFDLYLNQIEKDLGYKIKMKII